jgi:uroporphyrinogen III methyltransferase/synthase
LNIHPVYLVGAGPGHPGLITLRAVECLAQADFVLYDKLVSPGLLHYAPDQAERMCVSQIAKYHPERYREIQQVLIEQARAGKRVVHLKGGDPFLFGRGGEEAEALRAAGIPFEVVPGVTSGLAAAAFAGIPATHRLHASAVALVTGHENPSKPHSNLDWQALAGFPGTLIFYMGIAGLAQIARHLVEHGKPSETPAAVIQWATTGNQRTVEAPLGDIAEAVLAAGLMAPAIVVVGSVASLRPQIAWFERRPLFGKRVLVTRPRRQAGDLVHRLEELGAVAYVQPAVDIREPHDWSPVDSALARLTEFQWLVFTSANGVHAFVQRLRQQGRDLRALGHLQLAVIGPGTADALRHYHLEPDVVPSEFRSEYLAAALKERVAGLQVLLARADRGRDVLRDELSQIARVEQVAVYSQVDVEPDAEILDHLRRGEIEFITVTSSNIARSLARGFDATIRGRIESGVLKMISISPVTSAALSELGWPVAAEAKEYTAAGVVAALVEFCGRNQPTAVS